MKQKTLKIKIMHWLITAMFLVAVLSGYRQADTGWSGIGIFNRSIINAAHETTGILIAIIFVYWAFSRAYYRLNTNNIGFWNLSIGLFHMLFGSVGFSIALLGWMGSSAGNYGQMLFGFIPMPNITPYLGAETSVFFTSLHKMLVPFFIALLVIHVASVIFHVVVLRDDTLKAMWFRRPIKK